MLLVWPAATNPVADRALCTRRPRAEPAMLTLTDSDRAAIRAAAEKSIYNIYLAGMRAGLERAAKVCEGTVSREAGYGGQWEGYGRLKTERTGSECAAAILALAE